MTGARFHAAPQPGDVVWCVFPLHRSLRPGPKPRPALVLQAGEQHGDCWVNVAYGTSQKTGELFTGEFAILSEDGDAFILSGLSYPTKFDIGRAVDLPFSEEWFAVAPRTPFGQHPKLGVLHPSLLKRARAVFLAARSGKP